MRWLEDVEIVYREQKVNGGGKKKIIQKNDVYRK
jgi:hypothetical protein